MNVAAEYLEAFRVACPHASIPAIESNSDGTFTVIDDTGTQTVVSAERLAVMSAWLLKSVEGAPPYESIRTQAEKKPGVDRGWIDEYQDAYRRANEGSEPPEIKVYSPGWYFFKHADGSRSANMRRSHIEACTGRLLARATAVDREMATMVDEDR